MKILKLVVNINQMKDKRSDTMFIGEKGKDMRAELGLTDERGNELMRITRSIVEQVAIGGKGRTSCVLLTISGRKDLTDTEKVICSFIFSSGAFDGNKLRSKPSATKFELGMGMDVECVVVAPDGMGSRDIMAMTMAMLMSQLREMPPNVVREFCKNASELFAKIAETGEPRV